MFSIKYRDFHNEKYKNKANSFWTNVYVESERSYTYNRDGFLIFIMIRKNTDSRVFL